MTRHPFSTKPSATPPRLRHGVLIPCTSNTFPSLLGPPLIDPQTPIRSVHVPRTREDIGRVGEFSDFRRGEGGQEGGEGRGNGFLCAQGGGGAGVEVEEGEGEGSGAEGDGYGDGLRQGGAQRRSHRSVECK